MLDETSNTTVLNLSYQNLQQLPSEIGNLTNLIDLPLQGNQLKQLPSEIGNLTNLEKLSLSNNQLQQLPSEIGNLTNLQEICLTYNQLQQLPSEIGNLTNLKKLFLWDNKLQKLPLTILNLDLNLECIHYNLINTNYYTIYNKNDIQHLFFPKLKTIKLHRDKQLYTIITMNKLNVLPTLCIETLVDYIN